MENFYHELDQFSVSLLNTNKFLENALDNFFNWGSRSSTSLNKINLLLLKYKTKIIRHFYTLKYVKCYSKYHDLCTRPTLCKNLLPTRTYSDSVSQCTKKFCIYTIYNILLLLHRCIDSLSGLVKVIFHRSPYDLLH